MRTPWNNIKDHGGSPDPILKTTNSIINITNMHLHTTNTPID